MDINGKVDDANIAARENEKPPGQIDGVAVNNAMPLGGDTCEGQQSEGDNVSGRQSSGEAPSASDDQHSRGRIHDNAEIGEASSNPQGAAKMEKGTEAASKDVDKHPADESGSTSGPPVGEKTESSKKPKKKKKKSISYYSPYDLNERDEDENTPLHVAVHACKLEHVKLLLEAGASSARRCDGSFPVHTAISMGGIGKNADFAHDCVALLVGHGADLSLKDDSFHTPLYLACEMNLPRVVSFILSDSEGMSTLNVRSDRSGGRPLHAAAKFDVPSNLSSARPSVSMPGAASHHQDGSVIHSAHQVIGMSFMDISSDPMSHAVSKGLMRYSSENIAPVTQMLLAQTGVEVDAQNMQGHTPLHVACSRGNWPVVRLLLKANADPSIPDKRGFTPVQLALKRGIPIPNNLVASLGDHSPTVAILTPPRDLVVDPDNTTFLISHELCMLHRSCPPIRRDSGMEPPPENVRRLHVLVNEKDGILRCNEFGRMVWQNHARRAAIADVLKCHEYEYVEKISLLCSAIPDHPAAIAHLDADTAVSRWSFEAALRAAGSVCEAVDKVVNGDHRNAFCAVRPPGHHAGPRGVVRCANDPDGGSHGFCLLNNVAIGAAYARSVYRHAGIKKIAIIDFDVHHGNGTEEIIRQLVPTTERAFVKAPFAVGELSSNRYRPWLDETDINDVFFASTHGYGPRGSEFLGESSCCPRSIRDWSCLTFVSADLPPQQAGWFYPASGKSQETDALANPSLVERPNLNDFMLSQTWSRMGEESRLNCCKIINCGLGLPARDALPGMQRLEVRDTYRKKILPRLREFDPDIIFISAGFDAHRKDTMNFGYVGMVEDDYEWLTEQLVKVANSCCNGRIVSVLEGGYKVHGGIVSPFARSVGSHVRALVDGGRSRELYDANDLKWESEFESQILNERRRIANANLKKQKSELAKRTRR